MKVLTTVEAQLQTLSNPQVRDLGWACFSQALCLLQRRAGVCENTGRWISTLQSSLFAASPSRLAWLQQLDKDSSALQAHLDARHGRRRLGIYFEHLVEFFLLNEPTLELATRNLPVREGGHTIGEFDFLYYDRASASANELIHLEVAVKFYLGLPPELRGGFSHCWRGPGSHDAFEMKLSKMITQQSRLGEQDQAQAALSDIGLEQPRIQRIAVAGELFQPLKNSVPFPEECLPLHHSAYWCYLTELEAFLGCNSALVLLEKSQWLTPLPEGHSERYGVKPSKALAQLHEYFASTNFPVMLEILRAGRQQRMFVVPSNWPATGIENGAAG